MKLRWTGKAVSDLERLHDLLVSVNPKAAATTIQSLVHRVGALLEHPRLGEQLDLYEPREVRRILIGRYEVRYELDARGIHVLRIWHTRENRF